MRYNAKRKQFASQCNELNLHNKNIYQLTRFVYGRNRMLQTAIVDLVEKGVLVPQMYGQFRVKQKPANADADNNPVVSYLSRYYSPDETLTMQDLSFLSKDEKTYDDELALLSGGIKKWDLTAIAAFVIVLATGVARLIQGMANDKPVAVLAVMVVLFAFAGSAALHYVFDRNVLQQVFKVKFKQQQFREESLGASSMALGFAFLGITAISGMENEGRLTNSFQNYNNDRNNSSAAGGGCGSSGCGSSCGSSCGGGCGGCGG
jgi:uncharacterized protein (TIGR04222 family)